MYGRTSFNKAVKVRRLSVARLHILQALQTASQFAYSGRQNVFYRQTLYAMP